MTKPEVVNTFQHPEIGFLFQDLAVEVTGIISLSGTFDKANMARSFGLSMFKGNDQGFTVESQREPGNPQVYIAECLFVP